MNISSMLENMDEETANNILSNIDKSTINRYLQQGIEEHLVPHFEEVKEKAIMEYKPPREVREHYESLSPEKQEEKFNRAASDLLSVMTQLRTEPHGAGTELKKRLRDPWTVEALLLIFEHEDLPREEVERQKNYAATWIKWAGVNVMPEMYTEDEIRDVVEELFSEEQVEETVRQLTE